ncbi:CheR family methyltransferase [Ornithinibacillus halotolerans]|uniref:protein-glutamate O-methyltransferase n=1 Tax=Ornithinibacillus halotolerans TaxID=1274357 RepID=A0A916W2N4_9BACI|nr:protein-glutamate O-methyltransferase CheR [Ornithinibacillus halotolerans]GGA61330.1 chemotaxis protein methyltransferase [Ornithinibacillus halotolerans]
MRDDYKEFTEKVYLKLGIDLQQYKEAQMKRRLTTLRDKRGYSNFTSYFHAISKDTDLLNEFLDRITINVSEFYRNPKRWETLQNIVLPALTKNKKHITIWSAACSTGEEPYSIAIMLNEYFPDVKATILATDIDEIVLEKARKGVYHEQSLKDLPHNLKKKYFKQVGTFQAIDANIKRKITFRKHNLLEDTYPSNIDLIICRNVLIYFTDVAKETIYQQFSTSLLPDGILFVGSTEQIFSPSKYNLKLLETFFYQKNNET